MFVTNEHCMYSICILNGFYSGNLNIFVYNIYINTTLAVSSSFLILVLYNIHTTLAISILKLFQKQNKNMPRRYSRLRSNSCSA